MYALQSDASHLLAEYVSSNSHCCDCMRTLGLHYG